MEYFIEQGNGSKDTLKKEQLNITKRQTILNRHKMAGERILNTSEIMAMPDLWNPLKEVIDSVVDEYKRKYPQFKVELVDKHTCWHIEVNGVPAEEIDCQDIRGQIN